MPAKPTLDDAATSHGARMGRGWRFEHPGLAATVVEQYERKVTVGWDHALNPAGNRRGHGFGQEIRMDRAIRGWRVLQRGYGVGVC